MIDLETILIASGLVALILSNVLTGLLVWFWRAKKALRDAEKGQAVVILKRGQLPRWKPRIHPRTRLPER